MTVQTYNTEYGVIKVSTPGPYKKYDNVQTYHQTAERDVTLQGPALRAFKKAEEKCATQKKRHILITGVGYRSFDLQAQLYASDPGRFANPDSSMHVEALAVDVDQGQGFLRLRRIKKALQAQGWHYSVSGEPWHASFHVSG